MEGWTALHFACQYGQLDVAKLISEKGGDMNATDIVSTRVIESSIFS